LFQGFLEERELFFHTDGERALDAGTRKFAASVAILAKLGWKVAEIVGAGVVREAKPPPGHVSDQIKPPCSA